MPMTACIHDQKGNALIMTIVVLVAITALGLTMNRLSVNQIDMTSNLKAKEIARYNCDSCTIAVNKLIRHIVDESQEGRLGVTEGGNLALGMAYISTAADPAVEFAQKVLFNANPAQSCEDVRINPNAVVASINAAGGNLQILPTELDAAADIRQSAQGTNLAGTSSMEFAAGYGYGLGGGGAAGGGMAVKFLIACRGRGPNNAVHVGYSVYRKPLKSGPGE